MNVMNSYLELGLSDLRFSLHGYEENEYNQVCSLGVQAVEKFLKAILEVKAIGIDSTILKTHNLKKLIKEVNDCVSNFKNDTSKIFQISSYYFDVRYPGENFYEPSYEDALVVTYEAYDIYQRTCKILGVEEVDLKIHEKVNSKNKIQSSDN